MQKREYGLPELVKPIFIEDSFIAPMFNEVMAEELQNACDWINGEETEPLLKSTVVEIIAELINFNKKLLDKYEFDEKWEDTLMLADDYKNVNPGIRVNAIENVVISEYLKDYRGFQELLYYVTDMLFRFRFSDTVDAYTENECYMLKLLFRFLDELYSGNHGYYTVMGNKYEF